MRQADLRTTLRALAVAIAIAAAIDPEIPIVDAVARPVVVVNGSAAGVASSQRALQDVIGDRPVVAREVTNGRLPCASDEDCVLVADGSVDVDWDQRLRPMVLIKTPITGEPNVRVRSVTISRGHHAAAGVARVELEGRGVEGKRTEVRVFDGPAVLGAIWHEWSTGGRAAVDVQWWPIAAGARALRIEATPTAGEITAIDNRIDVGVTIETAKIPVLIVDSRPSWHSTFVRRALEDDARFTVRYRGRLAPSLSSGTANGRLDVETLDQVPLVIAGGPDALTAHEVSLLERYVQVRGGTLVMLPERAPSGEASRLFTGHWTEHLSPSQEPVGPLRASELLRVKNPSPAATVLAASGASPVIISNPTGAGRIIVSGAMDAWRYRDFDSGAFDRFWRSLAAEAAAAGEALSIDLATDVLERGARAAFTLRDRRLQRAASSEASVVQRCGDGPARSVRVWPRGPIGEFGGEVSALADGACTLEATVSGRQVSASIAVVDRASRGVDDTLAKLERRVRASGGAVGNTGEESRLAGALGNIPVASRDVTAHPMRPAWWMIPFVTCLSIEWWLRRRAGLR